MYQPGKVFSWRPALENVLLDALELSVDDVLARQPQKPENFSSPDVRQRPQIKSQIKEAIRSSQLWEFESLVAGKSKKRQRVNIDSN